MVSLTMLCKVNPLSPNSDLNQISHCCIKGLSVREVLRIENMISHDSFDFLIASPHYFCKRCTETRSENLWFDIGA